MSEEIKQEVKQEVVNRDYLNKKLKNLHELRDDFQNKYFQVLGMIQMTNQILEDLDSKPEKK